ncbi:MAG: D-glycero-D-manno-heptose 1,7-bisphosphate phosphatase [Gemmatimonadaceae bacterium]|jgi:histidinol-phosphate phosphatase family protein|nr:D-glycero-D-manno-heptose 1,7-bisphosphate phosphatase [Gemmatimonadaceae bacterium]
MEDAHYIKSPDQVRLIPGAAAAVKKINDAGIPVIVVTNQSGIGRGMFTVKDYEAVKTRFESLLAREGAHIDASYYCPDHPSATGPSKCRKPATQMFEDAIRDFNLNPANVAYVGDRWRDVAASKNLGGRGIMIASHMTTDDDRRKADNDGIATAASLQEAVDMILGLTEKDGSA